MSTILDRQLMSLYVTLLLSVGCLGYAEMGQQLPETPFFYTLMLLALGAAYRAEGKFSLSIKASNALAGLVILAGAGWLFLKREPTTSEFEAGFNLIRSLVSRAGPVLCALLLAKLFRPKTGSDQWLLQLLGLVQVILASVLAMSGRMDREAPLFPVLMILYLSSLAWSFRLFYLRHECEQMSPGANETAMPTVHWFSMKPVGWFLASFVIAVVIFFCLPQGGIDGSMFQSGDRSDTGATSKIDLNAEGTIQVSDEKVMLIKAYNRNGPVVLPEGMRLRGAVLSVYEENAGIWKPFPTSSITPQKLPTTSGILGDNVTRMEYDIDAAQIQELGRPRNVRYSSDFTVPLFLADPPVISNYYAQNFSMASSSGRSQTPMSSNVFEGQSWLVLPKKMSSVSIVHDYSGRLNAMQWEQNLKDLPADYFHYLRAILTVPKRIKESKRIEKLCQDILTKANLGTSATIIEKARALERYLASNVFSYSIERKKQDTKIDPIEDFLFNVKEGHCERFASALTVMLRTIGIQSRIVIGYRGAEWNEMGGYYIVRQLHAHAWVEALIEESRPADRSYRLLWQVFDPTPANQSRNNDSSLSSPLTFARFLWEFFILDFAGQAQRSKLLAQIQNTWLGKLINWWMSLNSWQAALVLIGAVFFVIFSIWLLLRWRRRVRQRKYDPQPAQVTAIPFYSRLLHLLARRGWKPGTGQTPAEFASTVEYHLKKTPTGEKVSEIPAAIVPPYYAVRFGGQNLTEQQQSVVDQHLQTLQLALQQG